MGLRPSNFGRALDSWLLAVLLSGAGPLEVGVEVVGAGRGELKFAGHDGFGASPFQVVHETEVGGGGGALGEEDGRMWVGDGDEVVDDVALVVEVQGG